MLGVLRHFSLGSDSFLLNALLGTGHFGIGRLAGFGNKILFRDGCRVLRFGNELLNVVGSLLLSSLLLLVKLF